MLKFRKPYLELVFFTGWIDIHTAVWCSKYEHRIVEWIRVYVKIFKWKFDFKLYSPWERS